MGELAHGVEGQLSSLAISLAGEKRCNLVAKQ